MTPTHRLHIGKGYVDNVPAAVWRYEVSGKSVLRQWFSYRRNREPDHWRPAATVQAGDIQPDHWLAEYTTELLNVLHVLARWWSWSPSRRPCWTRSAPRR